MSNDTSTTAGKIAIMQAFEDGAECQWRYKGGTEWMLVEVPSWNWDGNEYRIKPTPRIIYVVIDNRGQTFLYDSQQSAVESAGRMDDEYQKDAPHRVSKFIEVTE